ncbi:MAG: ankyrin repeat domain-containing protein [Amoebophilaceae bacterium]|nr:ankyrin repeat domain-containing protein [Amoebophilaceae bacterium]
MIKKIFILFLLTAGVYKGCYPGEGAGSSTSSKQRLLGKTPADPSVHTCFQIQNHLLHVDLDKYLEEGCPEPQTYECTDIFITFSGTEPIQDFVFRKLLSTNIKRVTIRRSSTIDIPTLVSILPSHITHLYLGATLVHHMSLATLEEIYKKQPKNLNILPSIPQAIVLKLNQEDPNFNALFQEVAQESPEWQHYYKEFYWMSNKSDLLKQWIDEDIKMRVSLIKTDIGNNSLHKYGLGYKSLTEIIQNNRGMNQGLPFEDSYNPIRNIEKLINMLKNHTGAMWVFLTKTGIVNDCIWLQPDLVTQNQWDAHFDLGRKVMSEIIDNTNLHGNMLRTANVLFLNNYARSDKRLVKKILDNFSPNSASEFGTILHWYIANTEYERMDELINCYTTPEEAITLDLSIRDIKGNTPLILYIAKGNRGIPDGEYRDRLQKLINLSKNSAALNLQDFNGNTALHMATLRRDLCAIRLLLENGANPRLKNNYGKTSVDFCKINPGDIDPLDYFTINQGNKAYLYRTVLRAKFPTLDYTSYLRQNTPREIYNHIHNNNDPKAVEALFQLPDPSHPLDVINYILDMATTLDVNTTGENTCTHVTQDVYDAHSIGLQNIYRKCAGIIL